MYCDVREWHHTGRRILVASHPAAHPRERDTEKAGAAETRISRKTINKMAIEALGKNGKIRRSGRIVEAIDFSFQKCVGDQCNSQGCEASPPQIARTSCTSSSIASAAVGDLSVQPVTALTRCQIGANGGARRALQPSAPNAERSTPGGAYHPPSDSGAKLQSDPLLP